MSEPAFASGYVHPVVSQSVALAGLREAAHIGDRIVATAIGDGLACTWSVVTPDRSAKGRTSVSATASEALYQGAAGIAYFLGELWAATAEDEYLQYAQKALRYCIQLLAQKPPRASLHTGSIGVAVAAARLAELTRQDEYQVLAVQALAGIESVISVAPDDIITGSAGAILGLLRVARAIDMPQMANLAVRFGERLTKTARRAPAGWSWGSGVGFLQDLTGYAHGASGIAHAFLELYAMSGEARWRFAASRALAYESFHEVSGTGDWPDFRNMDLVGVLTSGEVEKLRARLLAGEPTASTGAPPIARAWCHGAPGIALSRIRAADLEIETEQMRGELGRALDATRDSLRKRLMRNQSLCHGVFGNLESFLIARERLGIDDSGLIEGFLEEALEEFGKGRGQWVTGVVGGVYDPSLLVGEAGIGLFLLRVVRRETSSALCISDWDRPTSKQSTQSDVELRNAELGHLLPNTVRAMLAPTTHRDLRDRIDVLVDSTPVIDELIARVRETIEEPEARADYRLRIAVSTDMAILDESAAFTDYSAQFYHELVQPRAHEIDWTAARVCLAPGSRLIHLKAAAMDWPNDASSDDACYAILVYRSGQRIEQQQLTELQHLIFQSLHEPIAVTDVISKVLSGIDVQPSEVADISTYIAAIVRDAVHSGAAQALQPGWNNRFDALQ